MRRSARPAGRATEAAKAATRAHRNLRHDVHVHSGRAVDRRVAVDVRVLVDGVANAAKSLSAFGLQVAPSSPTKRGDRNMQLRTVHVS